MTDDTHFLRYLPDPHPEGLVEPEKIRRHILCTGQVYQTLLQERQDKGINDVVISRLEQISPFPYDLVRSAILPQVIRTDECPKAFYLVANVVIFSAMRESRVESGVPCPTRR